jgi:hypothetical protein
MAEVINFNGGQTQTDGDEYVTNDYVITDIHNVEFFATGFLIFTSQHVAIMRESDKGALPIFLMPLDKVHSVELIEDDDDTAAA